MLKKIISGILVFALLSQAGCYSPQLISYNEYQKIEEEDGKPDNIRVTTKDTVEYHFFDQNYYFDSDTLYGKGTIIKIDEKLTSDVRIAISNIESIKVDVLDSSATIVVVGVLGGAVIAGLVFLIVALSAIASH
jgi:hypothetical protein